MPTAPGEQGAPGQVLYAQKDVWGQLGELVTESARARSYYSSKEVQKTC